MRKTHSKSNRSIAERKYEKKNNKTEQNIHMQPDKEVYSKTNLVESEYLASSSIAYNI